MDLTFEQKKAILDYVTSFSVNSILEDVDEIGQDWTEENDVEIRKAIEEFVTSCHEQVYKGLK